MPYCPSRVGWPLDYTISPISSACWIHIFCPSMMPSVLKEFSARNSCLWNMSLCKRSRLFPFSSSLPSQLSFLWQQTLHLSFFLVKWVPVYHPVLNCTQFLRIPVYTKQFSLAPNISALCFSISSLHLLASHIFRIKISPQPPTFLASITIV